MESALMLGMTKNGGSDWCVGVAHFYRVIDQTWEEETVTWNNAPAHDNTLVTSLGAVTTGTWYSVDLTSLITADGTYSLRVSSTSSNGADYSSRESANAPLLEIEVAGGPTATPGPTATVTETPTATLSQTATLTSTPTLTPQATSTLQTGATLTFAPLDDSYVHNGYPSTNYGTAAGLLVDNSPVEHILIKFQVEGLAGRTVTQATLRLYNTNESSIGGKFYRVNDQSWTEETVTWNNAPAADATEIASLGAVAIGNWYSVDLTSLITADGTYSLRVTSTSTNGADYSSKEGANPPVLELVVADSATATSGPTATPSQTPTHTATATHTLTATPTATATPQTYQMAYVYDGDGNLVKSVLGDVVTYYIGKHYEKQVQGSQQNERKYYFAGANRIAMRENGTLTWLLIDHLGSTSVTTDAGGNLVSSLRYTAFGEVRAAVGTTSTDYRYTGQRSEAEIGLYFYVARFFDPALGRFIQADSIVPDPYNPRDWDRYSYVRNNPINNTDPTGHRACSSFEDCEDFGTTPMGGDWADLYFSRLTESYAKTPSELSISTDGFDFIKSQEGLFLQLYNDGNLPDDPFFYDVAGGGQGNCTIGYGHLVHSGPCNGDLREANFINGIPNKQADEMLGNDVLPAEKGIRKYVKVKLTQPQYDALVSLVFNWGIDNFRASPKLSMLNNGDYADMALHLRKGPLGPNGQQYPGLISRREAELVMFLTMVDR